MSFQRSNVDSNDESNSDVVEITRTDFRVDRLRMQGTSLKRKALPGGDGEGSELLKMDEPPVKRTTGMWGAETNTEISLRKIVESINRLTEVVDGISDDVAQLQDSIADLASFGTVITEEDRILMDDLWEVFRKRHQTGSFLAALTRITRHLSLPPR